MLLIVGFNFGITLSDIVVIIIGTLFAYLIFYKMLKDERKNNVILEYDPFGDKNYTKIGK